MDFDNWYPGEGSKQEKERKFSWIDWANVLIGFATLVFTVLSQQFASTPAFQVAAKIFLGAFFVAFLIGPGLRAWDYAVDWVKSQAKTRKLNARTKSKLQTYEMLFPRLKKLFVGSYDASLQQFGVTGGIFTHEEIRLLGVSIESLEALLKLGKTEALRDLDIGMRAVFVFVQFRFENPVSFFLNSFKGSKEDLRFSPKPVQSEV